jgi:hypothetical protein
MSLGPLYSLSTKLHVLLTTRVNNQSSKWVQVCIRDGRSQWPRGLKHEISSPPRTLGSWVRIPLEACMSVCVYSVYVVLYRERPCVGLISHPRSPTDCLRLRNWSERIASRMPYAPSGSSRKYIREVLGSNLGWGTRSPDIVFEVSLSPWNNAIVRQVRKRSFPSTFFPFRFSLILSLGVM